jgi:hypothetical protein
VDEQGNVVGSDVIMNPHRYEVNLGNAGLPEAEESDDPSAGMNFVSKNKPKQKKPWSINKT